MCIGARGCGICVLEPHISAFGYLLPYHVCITPSLKLSSSRLRGRHGTTAAAQQVCVDMAMRVCCVLIRALVWVCAGLCICVPGAGTPHLFEIKKKCFCLLCFTAAAAAVLCLYHTVPQALYVVATVKQQSHSKFVLTCIYQVYACVDMHIYACVQ